MKRILPFSFFSICAIFLLGFNVSCTRAEGSGKITTEKRPLSGFTGIEVEGAFEVEVSQSDSYSVEVSTDDDVLPKVITHVDGEVLKIEKHETDLFNSPTVHIKISLPALSALELHGASHGIAKNIKADKLNLEVSGASKLLVSGHVSDLHSEVKGASKLDAKELIAGNAEVECLGASNAFVHANTSLRITAAGASKVVYSGTAKVTEESSGASSIAQD